MNVRHALCIVVLAIAATAARATTLIPLEVDATQASRRVLHATLSIPTEPGPLTLLYPQWIPGEHSPNAPINDIGGLVIRANGAPLAWTRDSLDMFAFHVDVPQGARAVDVGLDVFLSKSGDGFSAGASTSANLLVLSWNQVVLYPRDAAREEIVYMPSLTLPPGWAYATALRGAQANGSRVTFAQTPLVTLVDSPVLAGQYMRSIRLAPEIVAPEHWLDMAADSPAALEMPRAQIDQLSRLVRETGALFGARHYTQYRFLYTLSDAVAHFGLEHHESSDNRVKERAAVDDDVRLNSAGLLPHEIVHSWNGKYRRPAGLVTRPFDEPQRTELLWVYEGLTNYLGDVLTARAGLRTPHEALDDVALTCAQLDAHTGRAWRNLLDTAVGAQALYYAPSEWQDQRRGTDFYEESNLLWLDADVFIRRATGGKRSLDDFCRAFCGGADSGPAVRAYTFEDVVAGLQATAPNDWATFLRTRLTRVTGHLPLDALEAAGWSLVYTDSATSVEKATDAAREQHDWSWSLGFVVKKDDTIGDIVPGSPAARAGLAPGVALVAVNGRAYSDQVLRDAVRAAKGTNAPLEILAKNGDFFDTYRIEYHDGEKHPRLARRAGAPDLLARILAPRTRPPK